MPSQNARRGLLSTVLTRDIPVTMVVGIGREQHCNAQMNSRQPSPFLLDTNPVLPHILMPLFCATDKKNGTVSQTARGTVNEIMAYVRQQSDKLDIKLSRWMSGIGILCFVFGGLLLFMRIAVGSLVAPTPTRRRARPAPRKLFK